MGIGVGVASGADYYWDPDNDNSDNVLITGAGLGDAGTWDLLNTFWWDGTNPDIAWPNLAADRAIFTGAYVAGAPVANTVTLGSGLVANQLRFLRSGYTLTSGDLTLGGTAPGFWANLGESATVSSQILGSSGLTKSGGGSVRLTGSNGYTGTTTIDAGTVSINSQAALGADSSTVVVNGSATRGLLGGTLLLEGSYASGMTFSRGLSLQGLGPTSTGAALASVGTNTVTGAISNGSALVNTAVSATGGRLTMGDVTVGSTTYITFGSSNGTGSGSYAITGSVSGTGNLQKTGQGTLFFNPSNAAGWSGILQMSGGSVRVTDTAAFGTSTATNAIDLNGGLLELRADSLTFASAKRINLNNGSGATDLLLDHAPGSTVLNQTATFANLDYDAAETLVINTRNGYGATFTAATAIGAGTDVNTFTNNGNGLVTYGGTLWGMTDNAAHTLTINGTGNSLLSGSITATTAAHPFTKSGTGSVTVQGTASTYTGATTMSGGALVVTDFRSLNAHSTGTNTAAINIGSSTTAGILTIGTSTAATAAGLTLVGKTLALNGTTGGATINANQTFAAPVLIGSGVTISSGAGTKVLTLGGTSTQDNAINAVIVNNSAANITQIVKADAGTWKLGGTNTNTGATLITGGTLKLGGTTILGDTTAVGFGQNATTFWAGGTLNQTAASGTETVGPLDIVSGANTITVSGAAGGLNFASVGTTQTAATQTSSTTVTVGSTSGLVPGMVILGGSAAATISSITNGTQFVASAAQVFASPTVLTFGRPSGTSQNSGGTVNFTPGTGSVVIASVPAIGLLNAYSYVNGANFAYAPATTNATLRAPVYGTDAGFNTVAASGTLTASSNNLINSTSGASGTVTQGSVVTVPTIKFATGTTLTANALVTLQTAANSPGGILLSGGSATINGSNGITSGGTGDVVIRTDLSGDTLTLSATGGITSTTTGGLTKSGAGTLVISATNAQTGTTNINEGKIQLSGTGKISGNSAGLNIRQGASLDLNGVTMSGTAIGALNGAGTIANTSATAATVTVGNGNGTGTFSGTFNQTSGIISVTKNGTGNQTWSGSSNYTGTTTIASTGIVSVATLANIGSDSGIGRGNSTDDTTNAASLVFSGTTGGLAYTGTTSVSIDRLFTMSGGGQIANNSGNNSTLILNKTNVITFGTTASQTLTLGGSSTGDNQINLQLANPSGGSLGVNKIGAGLWILGNSGNSYTGTTQIGVTTTAGGVLQAVDGSTLPNASYLLLGGTTGGGVFQSSGNFVRSIGTSAAANTVSFNSTLTTGAVGFSASDSKLVVSLGGLATPTALTWGSGGFMGVSGTSTGAFVLSSSTALAEVEIRNAINLNGVNRTIQVDDNTNTFADFATISGVISGTASLTKTGTGTLQLLGANTYSGTTTITSTSTTASALVVNSLGNSASPGVGTSVGTSTGANLSTNAVLLGNGTTNPGILDYVGPGETSDRMIRINTTTGTGSSVQIHADGSGPLILTNVVNDLAAGDKLLYLRGSNTQGNMITSTLTDNGGTLGVTIDSGASWILTGNNTYTGTTTLSGGALGLGHDSATGAGNLDLSNGALFAYGADRTLTNPVRLANNTTSAVAGDYSINVSNPLQVLASANNVGLNNGIAAGKTLTVAGATANSLGVNNRTWTIDGSGTTIINGDFTTDGNAGVNLTKTGDGLLQLNGNTASNFNQNNNAIDLDRGTLRVGANEVIPNTYSPGSTTTTSAVTSSAVIPVASTAGLAVGQFFTGTGVTTGAKILTIDSPTQFTAATAQTIANSATLTFVASGGLTLSPELATADTATFDLNGKTETVTSLTASTDGNAVIDNSSASPATFRFGANNSAVSFGTGLGTYSITNTGGGALSIVKMGNTSATIPVGVTLSYQGSTESEGGGSFTLASAVTGTSALKASGNSTLALTGGITNPALITSIEVGAGSTLSLLDGAGSAISNLTSLSLGNTGAGTVTLNLNVGDGATDTLTLLSGGTLNLGSTITFNMTDAGLNPSTTYTLLNLTDGGITAFGASNIIQGATPGGFTGSSWVVTNNQVQFTTGTLITGSSWWNAGGAADNWSDVANWAITDKTGATPAASIPGQGTDVVFIADNITGGGAIATTLEQNIKINSLTFEASTTPTNTPSSVTVAPGTIATNRLEVAPQVATDGVKITAGGPTSVTISSPFKLGNHQTWNVADAGTTLTISGALFGEKDVTKTGSGKVTLTAAADSTFNTGLTSDFTLNGGTLEITNAGALGTAANSNPANVTLNSGSLFYFNNAVQATVASPLTLNGGTLAAGGASQIYGGAVSVTANSTINTGDLGTSLTTGRSNYLRGVVSGSGKITVDGPTTVSGGNQTSGAIVLEQANTSWSGGLEMNRGTTYLRNANGLGTGAVTVHLGRMIFDSVTNNGVTWNLGNAFTLDGTSGNAILELQADNANASPSLASPFTVNLTQPFTLGGSGATPILRVYEADVGSRVGFNGGIVLKANALMHTSGPSSSSFTEPTIVIGTTGISESGGSFGINFNGDTTWASNNYQNIRIDAAGTYTGGTTLSAGRLILNHTQAIGTAGNLALNGGFLQLGVDMSGANAFTRNLTIGGNVTFEGNHFEVTGTTTQSGGNRTVTNSLDSGKTLTLGAVDLSADTTAYTLTLTGTGLTTINGAIADGGGSSGGGLTYTGSSTLTFNGASTYSGTTTINNASANVLVNAGGSIGTGPLVVTAGSLNFYATASQNITSLTMGGGAAGSASTIDLQGGTLTLNGDVTYSATNNPLAALFQNGNLSLGGATRTFTIGDSTGATAADMTVGAVISDGSSTAGLIKAGAGILNLTGNNSFTDAVTVNAGTLQFATVTNAGGAASNLGQGSSLGLGGGTLAFVGSSSQSTDRPVTVTASSTLATQGDAGTSITYNGAITAAGGTFSVTLTGTDANRYGYISGGINQAGAGAAADLAVNSGTWTLSGVSSVIADDVIVTGTTAVLNLDSAGILTYQDNGTSNNLYSRTGATINLGADDVVPIGSNFDTILVGDSGGPEIGVFNTNTFAITVPTLQLGARATGLEGLINGSGTINAAAINLYRGIVNAKLANTGSTMLLKSGPGTVVLKGDNSGITSSGVTRVEEGVLELNYTANNSAKVNAASALDMRGGTLLIAGNASAATSQAVAGLTLAGGGSSTITVVPGSGQDAVLDLGATLTRSTSQGTIRFQLPTGTQSATRGILTTAPLTNGLLGGFATVTDASGTWFATTSGSNLVGLVSTANNNVTTWSNGDHVTDQTTGYTGSVSAATRINSLRFNAAGGSDLVLGGTGVLNLASGGILVTGSVTSGTPSITGGRLGNGTAGELIVTQDSAQTFEIGSYLDPVNVFTAAPLTKSGAGTLLLTNNAAAGTTNIQSGTLQVNGSNGILDTSAVVLAANQASTLDLQGDETIGLLSGGNATTGSLYGVVSLNSRTLTLNQSDNDGTAAEAFTFAGTFTGNGTLIRNGADYLVLSGNSSGFTGNAIFNAGRVDLSGATGRLSSAASYTLNAGAELLFRQDQTSAVDRLGNSSTITLNNTAGTSAIAGSFGLRNYNQNQNATRTENVGTIILGAGHNMIVSEPADTGTSCVADLVADTLTRNNRSTLLVHALSLGASTGRRGLIRFDSGAQTTVDGYEVGGGGAAGTTNISIIPFLVGELTNTGLGNSFVTNVNSADGLRPLAASEYTTDAAGYNALTGASTNNVRFATSGAITLTGTPTAINSLVLDSSSAITLNGPASNLEITSGAILSAQAGADTIQTFTGLTTGSARDYTVYVTTSGASLTISSPLTTAAPLVKAGAGTLILGSTSNAFTDVYFNQGIVQADDLLKLGSGAFNFYGGTLKFGAAFDPSTKAITFGTGGATFDTNGFSFSLANAVGNGGSGDFVKAGAGVLTMSVAPTHTGTTRVSGGSLDMPTINAGTTSALLVAGDSGSVSSTIASGLSVQSLVVGGVYSGTGNSSGSLTVGAGAVTIGDGSGDDYMYVGYRDLFAGNGASGSTVGTADFSAASSVAINVDTLALGYHPLGGGNTVASGSLTLSNTSNTVTARAIVMSDSVSSALTTASTIALGTGATTFNVNEFAIGRRKGSAAVTLGAGGTYILRNRSGLGGANLFVGDNDSGTTGTVSTGTLDLSAGTADAILNTVIVGRGPTGNSSGGATGTVSFGSGANAVSMNSLLIGQMRNGNAPGAGTIAQGTMTFGGGTMNIAGDVTLGDWSDDSGTDGTAKGTLALNGGTVNIAGNVGKTDSDRSSAILSVNGAAVDLKPAGDSTAGTVTVSQLNFSAGSIANAGAVTLDGRGVTNGSTFAPLDYALVLGDVTAPFNAALTNATAAKGGVQYSGTGAGATISGGIDLGAVERPFNVADGAGASDLTVSGVISGSGGFNKSGTGTMSLAGSAANTYAGLTTVSGGILAINRSDALGTTAGGTSLTPGGALSLSNNISVAGESLSLAASGPGEAILSSASGSNAWSGDLTVDTGSDASKRVRLLSDAGANLLVSGNVALAAGTADFVIGGDGNGEISGVITGSQRLFKSSAGTGTWILSADNSATFTGKTAVGNGVLQIASESNLGATPGSVVANQLALGGASAMGTLRTTAPMSLSVNRGVTLGTNGGALSPDAASTLTVGSAITGAGALQKTGSGTVILQNASDYTGGTTVTTGTLLANNSTGSATGSGPVTVNGGTLGGTGSIAGTTAINTGANLTAGTNGTVGTLAFGGDLTASAGSTWLVDFVSGLADFVNVQSGVLTLGGGINIADDGSWTPYQSYQIASYHTLSGNFSNAVTSGVQVGNFLIDYGSGTDGFITLTAVPEPETWVPALVILALGLAFRRRRR